MKFYKITLNILLILVITSSISSPKIIYEWNTKIPIIGKIDYLTVNKRKMYLKNIGNNNNIGIYEMISANGRLYNDKNLPIGTKLRIPTQFILPNVYHEGIVINLAEFRLYYFDPDNNRVITFPVGVGRTVAPTPIWDGKIIKKVENPTWIVPDGVRERALERGKTLPYSIPPGPNNPLGTRALYTNKPLYLIHGTNVPSSVGIRSSSGCIRSHKQNIEYLYDQVELNTRIQIINEPYKVAKIGEHIYIESHIPFQEDFYMMHANQQQVMDLIVAHTGINPNIVDWQKTMEIVEKYEGIPRRIVLFD